ncbi:UDP-N-acetylmuramoyl-L-alanyl-D-glutamate--2,6-diaminopimelate ligase [Nitrosomonas supralitoralis]|uniref:UDP-N-acetylmuramoyl-L-alanyl-D-glutamate--2,6-diaminopimelate ligase n=1 Tax=Nitrosomonas supralitoralis TaxID=2116706 RepID=A0A2P7NSI2_9PROT|nr:UDP-N-acetylmuramoyl-L-alanyl-D-glutamate--2,6-diaminopimelate ligase [Nitrosomonas supralitoralis]PSJ16405.1 UDP-N-acetylmuramoyl-L-alanyl-D-glutamate--2,6-diaminopimelate ligase [Nitrosomonas supralitoralis]
MTAKSKGSKGFDFHLLEVLGVVIRNLVADSRQIKPGDTFVAYPGDTTDGRKFIPQAIAAGANAILWDPRNFAWKSEWHIPALAVDDLKMKAGLIAGHIYDYPSQKLWMVGITGTNGKTSCSHWFAQAMSSLGYKTAVQGTLGRGFIGKLEVSENTTPDATILQHSLKEFVDEGTKSVVMEVSSHGLVQGRVIGTKFSVAVFTNLSRDHLDYHQDMDAYAAVKASLFFWPELKYAVVNMDDVLGVEISRQLANKTTKIIGYGFCYPEESDSKQFKMVHGSNLKFDIHGMEFDIEFEDNHEHLRVDLLGKFNASNLLAVIAALLASGIQLPDAIRALQSVQPIPGRMEKYYESNQSIIIVDYAHTPDALEKALCTLRELLRIEGRDARLFCVVGCGGDRDKGKRALVGEVATRLADEVIFTSDNPRSEDPLRIIKDIAAGAVKGNYQLEVDRALAIYQAIANARNGDIVLIAGKGHEKFQEVKGQKISFSDAEVAQQVLKELSVKVRVQQ